METESRSPRGMHVGDYVTVEIKPEDVHLILSIKQHMETVSISNCVCRVPRIVSRKSATSYLPDLVSIGPFHHGEAKLIATEDKKWRYLNTLLSRKPNLEATLDHCVSALKELEPKVRKFYVEKINRGSDELVKMMLVDGCFIIELFLKYSIKVLRRRDDPFFNKKDTFFRLRCDIILLENQIPFFVLQRLFSLVPIPTQCTRPLIDLALSFFRRMIPGDDLILQGNFRQDYNHLLDLIHNCYLPTQLEVQPRVAKKKLHCATKIQESGIRFRKVTAESLLDIKFVRGILEIPPLKIHEYTEIVFRNLIALEDCNPDHPMYVTSYAVLMGKLVQSKKDVRLLYRRRILTNGLERREEILDLFKKLHVKLNVNDFYYKGLCEQVSEYKTANWGVWCKQMKQRHCRSPLAIILAILLLVLTFTGTLFTVLSFSHHHF
ncbi:UPF0481 protein At3g47200-like [Actinidia eriantha]|uniref:UPF0481 protein At3g47200-like n=1 Tax=Actinidia eriantha TaxID=165200 RepID=UPI0025856FA8|nr:UPF0481 protein At3g47200-like [Actinidia eriantha]